MPKSVCLALALAGLILHGGGIPEVAAQSVPDLLSGNTLLEQPGTHVTAATPLSYVTVQDHGPSTNRWDLVLLGDGYTADAMPQYQDDVASWIDHFFSAEPYARYRNFFNVHRIDLVSEQSGADIPPDGVFRDTALGATYYWNGVTERLLYVDDSLVAQAIDEAFAGVEGIEGDAIVPVNQAKYGGGGGTYAVYSAGNGWGNEIALHEMGHSLHQLSDEYGGSPGPYPFGEPSAPNVTKDPTGKKWDHWIGYNQPGIGTIGVYEGALGYETGAFRPSRDSKMRSLGKPFDAVSRERMIHDLYRFVDPLDAWLDSSTSLENPEAIWIDVIDPDVIDVEWLVNGVVLEAAEGELFRPRDHLLAPGPHTVTARAHDPSDWVRVGQSRLEQIVNWQIELYVPGDTNSDWQVDLADFLLLKENFGLPATWDGGDFDGSGRVNLSDFLILKSNFGQAVAVPEPSTAVLLAIGCLAAALFACARLRSR